MSTMSFEDRFADELSSLLPLGVDVRSDQDLIVITLGTASVNMFTPGGDRRRIIRPSEARAFLADAARKLSGEIPKYREEFKAHARDLVETLRIYSGTNNAEKYREGHLAGYRAEPPTYSNDPHWVKGYRDGWHLAVKYGAIVSPKDSPLN